MSIKSDFPEHSRVIIAAFSGWSDAASAATDVLTYLNKSFEHSVIGTLDGDEFYNYQETKPEFGINEDGTRILYWPSTEVRRVSIPALPNTEVIFIQGIEPSLKWRTFIRALFDMLPTGGHTLVVTLGAMLTDVDYKRPFEVRGFSTDSVIHELTGYKPSKYEGETSLTGVFGAESERRGLSTVSLWAEVPHYVASPPCPKATLALAKAVEDILAVSFTLTELADDAKDWELAIEQLVADDEDLAFYLSQLAQVEDTTDLEQTSGDEIAKAFERYLRRPKR